jgi:hypothetical protein
LEEQGQGQIMPRESVKDHCGRCSRRVRHIIAVVDDVERKLCVNCDAWIIRCLVVTVTLRDPYRESFEPEPEMALS